MIGFHLGRVARGDGFALRGALLLVGLASMGLGALGAEPVKSEAKMGMNFAGPADFSSEMPFKDVFRYSRAWISQEPNRGWGQGPELSLDENGWVRRLNPRCWAETPLCTITGGHYPSGVYTVLFEGSGTIEFNGPVEVRIRRPGRILILVDASKGGFFLRVRDIDPKNPIRNIRVIQPGFGSNFEEDPWNPNFLRLWKGVSCIRFMDFQLTNNSKVRTWSDRSTLQSATFTRAGIPVELMVDLANRLEADAWFCMPHMADDDYVRNFARMVKEKLDPKRKVYIEYSNEIWNGMFEQSRYAGKVGQDMGLSTKSWEAAWLYTAHRSLEIFDIWEKEFGKEKLVRVLPSQVVNTYIAEKILTYKNAYKKADALTIAPYLSLNVGPKSKPSLEEVVRWTPEQVLDHLETVSRPESRKWIRANKQLCDKYGLKLLAYEGGQHAVGIQGGENNETLTRLFQAANRHPRMEAIYQKHLDDWEKEGGDLFCNFSSMSVWTKWGSWGLLQHMNEDPSKSPKFRAVMGKAKDWGQPVSIPTGPLPFGPPPSAQP